MGWTRGVVAGQFVLPMREGMNASRMEQSVFHQYQSFADAPGMVDSIAKLRAFKLPLLEGRSFLDVGCNEGFYCGVALDQGASRAVGLDSHAGYIERARQRFPGAEFVVQSWEVLPEGTFDVILFASSMHYIDSSSKLIAQFVQFKSRLAADGVLVLETGIAPGGNSEFVRYIRPSGETVYYPTISALEDYLDQAGLTYRRVGFSEPGDGMPRQVLHIRRRLPVVLFVMGQPGVGKSSLARMLGKGSGVPRVYVDEIGNQLFRQRYPDQVFEQDVSNGCLEICHREPGSGVALVAAAIAADVQRMANGDQTVIVDGLDGQHNGFRQIFEATKAALGREFVVWSATRE